MIVAITKFKNSFVEDEESPVGKKKFEFNDAEDCIKGREKVGNKITSNLKRIICV